MTVQQQLITDLDRFTNAGLIPGDGALGPVTPGRWTRLLVGVHLSTTDGWVEVHRDGRPVLPRVHVPTLDVIDGHPDPVYVKQGIYRSSAWTCAHEVYLGPLTITDEQPCQTGT